MKSVRKRGQDIIMAAVVATYVAALLAMLFLREHAVDSYNLVPFRFVKDYIIDRGVLAFYNIAGNIVVFIPGGVYLALLNRNEKTLVNTAYIAAFSLEVEMVQYMTSRGVADIDDLMLNTLGGLLGIYLLRRLERRFGDRTRTAVIVISLITGVLFAALYFALYYGVFGIRIRIF